MSPSISLSPRSPRILLAAFDAYADGACFYGENASRLAVERVAAEPPAGVHLATRIYSVDFATIRRQVEQDVARGFDAILLTGQSPSSALPRLEMRARNFGFDHMGTAGGFLLAGDGEASIETTLFSPLLLAALAEQGHETLESDDAGDFLCNAALYFALLGARRRWGAGMGERLTRVGFVHLPLTPQQAAPGGPCMVTEAAAACLRAILQAATREYGARGV